MNTPSDDEKLSEEQDNQGEEQTAANDTFRKLRELILEPEQTRLDEIQQRVENPSLRAEDVSEILPKAIKMRSDADQDLAEALKPTIEQSITSSVKKDPRPLANALFPLMGPAIRKSITSKFRELIESLNNLLNSSFSLQGWKWRFEAWRTGKPYAEIVIYHTLQYRVEQVFLIHKTSGVLLRHEMTDMLETKDSDLVSAMLTAINDFVHDSFKMQDGDNLETLQIGDLSVWVEEGPYASMALVFRGNAPETLRSTMVDTLERIHKNFGDELKAFEGDTTDFELTGHQLRNCLQSQYKSKKKKISPLIWVLLAALIVFPAYWGYLEFKADEEWNSFVDALASNEGIVITSSARKGDRYIISGLRDPLAENPQNLLDNSSFAGKEVTMKWESFNSLAPEFVLSRSERILDPPPSVMLELKGTTLHLKGSVSQRWYASVKNIIAAIPGIMMVNIEELKIVDAGKEIFRLASSIENKTIFFAMATTGIPSSELTKLEAIVAELELLVEKATENEVSISLTVYGRADRLGSAYRNQAISRQRAEAVKLYLAQRFPRLNIDSFGLGGSYPLRETTEANAIELNRSVKIKVTIGTKLVNE